MAVIKKDGSSWYYQISYNDENGKKKFKKKRGFKTKRDAQNAASDVEMFLKDGLTKENIPLVKYFHDWYKIYKSDITPRTERHYLVTENALNKYFKNKTLKEIDTDSIQKFINAYGLGTEEIFKPHAQETVSKVYTHLKSALKRATKDGVYKFNPAEDVKVVYSVQKRNENDKYLTEKEQARLRKYLLETRTPKKFINYFILLGLDSGMRPGELIGLKWEDIDEQKNTIHIKRSFDYAVTQDYVPVKNNNPRNIFIPESTLTILNELKSSKEAVFLTYQGEHPSLNTISQQLNSILKKTEINKHLTPHGLRHSHASLMLYHGMNFKSLSNRLGHQNIQITLNTYSHIMEEMENEQNKIIQDTISNLYF